MFRISFVMRMSSSSQLSSGFDWSEESNGRKTQNNKREHEDDDESSDSETEVSEQVMRVQGNCAFDLALHEVMCYRFLAQVCKYFVKSVKHFLTKE